MSTPDSSEKPAAASTSPAPPAIAPPVAVSPVVATQVAPAKSGVASAIRGLAGLGAGIAALVVAIYLINWFFSVLVPSFFDRIGAATPGVIRDFLIWFSTDKTVEAVNQFGTEWGGILAILGVLLAVVFYFLPSPLSKPGDGQGKGRNP
jgi:hypothetical protein